MLDQAAAKTELRKLMDRKFKDFLGEVETRQQAIDRSIDQWANAWYECAKAVVPPTTSAQAAKAAFKTAAAGMYLDVSGAAFKAACAAFASALASGMVGAPVPQWTVVPPTALFNPIGGSQTDAEQWCEFVSGQMVAWLATGTATLIAPPNTMVNWS